MELSTYTATKMESITIDLEKVTGLEGATVDGGTKVNFTQLPKITIVPNEQINLAELVKNIGLGKYLE